MIELPKNRRETVRVSQREFGGRRLLDVRIWYPGEDGEMRPSSKGVSLALDQADELVAAIRTLAAQERPDD